MRQRTIYVIGILAVVEGRFVCWDSFKSAWFLGPRRLSEIFTWNPFHANESGRRLEEVLKLYPSARIRYETDPTA